MTDPSTPELPADAVELVSAYLDGEASAAEVARVESDPDLLAAADRLGRTSQLLRAGVLTEGSDAIVDRHVAAALDAFPATAATARVVDLGSERSRRWYDRVPLGAVAAAAVAIALVGAATQIDTGDSDDTATADVASEDAGDAASGGAGTGDDTAAVSDAEEGRGSVSPGLEAEVPTAAGGSARPDFVDTDSLAAHVREVVGTSRSSDQTEDSIAEDGQAEPFGDGADASSSCDAVRAAELGEAPVLLVLPVSVSGRDVTAVVADEETGRRLVVVDDLTCEVVDDRSL
jgi:hypothetical protein